MTIVGKFRSGNKTAQVLRVEKNGKVRFLAVSGKTILINKAFVRMYSAKSIVSQYLKTK